MGFKTALVTGASRGIGRSIALTLAANGYHLMITCHRNAEMLEEVKQYIESHFPVTCATFTGDMGDFLAVEQMYSVFTEYFSSLDVLVNNAGISHIGLLTDLSPEEWDRLLQTNLSSVFYTCRCGIPLMLRRKNGKIINISSVWGVVGASCETAYSATKGGVNALTRALAKELAPSNIQVNAIACGAIDTEMNSFMDEEELEALLMEIPAGRLGRPDEVASLVLDLCTENNYLTGQVIHLDGGWI
ncbi:SDR family NAD(P)-dependent oxidoreductase [Lachnospiraceae bacterium 46-15]